MTDATGVKGTMPHDIQALLPESCEFISGHPMAGRQGSGLGMSDAAIFNNSNYIIVPTEKNSPEAVRWLEEFAKALGCARSVKVADINPDLWSDLFLSNRANVIAEIENYQNQLERWKKAIENNDRETLKEIMREAGPRRRQLY